ncbi:MAG: hypothetical protein ACT4O0_10455 [Pseudonocardia sp.]|jgi:hypothetical protein
MAFAAEHLAAPDAAAPGLMVGAHVVGSAVLDHWALSGSHLTDPPGGRDLP